MSIIKNVSDSYKKSSVKFIGLSLLVLFGLIYSWLITVLLVIFILLLKKFKKEENIKKGTKKKCQHCKTEIDWDASRCPHCQGVIPVTTANTKIALVAFGLVMVLVVVQVSKLPPSSPSSGSTASSSVHSDIDVCVETQFLLKTFLKAPSTAEFPSCSNFVINKLSEEKFKVNSYVDSQNSFGAMIRSDWSITYHYLEGGTKTQLDYVVIDGEVMFER